MEEAKNKKLGGENPSLSVTWGVDGYGNKHFICKKCSKVLGIYKCELDINHSCGDNLIKSGQQSQGEI